MCLLSRIGSGAAAYRFLRTVKGATRRMELKVYKDTVTAALNICDAKVELPVEAELLIPDYQPQVFKIVKCFVTPVILQKQVLTGRISLEGYLRCVVFYQAEEEGSLCQAEQKLPFAKQVELSAGESQGAASVQVAGEVEYINCRALSGRRVDVRGALILHVTAQAQQDSEVVTALSGGGVCQRTVTLQADKSVGNAEKLFTAEQPVPFENPPAAVLNCQCAPMVEEVKLLAGKSVVRGQMQADITYRDAPGRTLLHQNASVPFNEILQVDGADEGCRAWASVQPTGCTLTQAEGAEGGQGISLAVTALIEVSVWRPVQTQAVCDAFSTAQEMELAAGDVALEKTGEPFSQMVETVAGGQMPDAGARVLDAFATALPPELVEREEGPLVRGRAVAHVLCENEMGEVDCYDKTCEYTLPLPQDLAARQLTLRCTAAVQKVSVRQTGDQVTASVALAVSGLVSARQSVPVLTGAVCTGPRADAGGDIALRIYFAHPGEQLFDIAKHYGASPDAIAAANGLEGEALAEERRLLIPRAQ